MPPSRRRQQGVALFIALVVLLIITILGISSLQTTTLEERMAAAARDRDIAFQAAEAALAQAELWIEGLAPGDLVNFQANAGGLFRPPTDPAEPDRWLAVDWQGGGGIVVGDDVPLPATSRQPRYIIEHLTTLVPEDETLNLSNIGQTIGAPTEVFRITAVGWGGSGRATVMLQSTYGKVM